VLAPEEKILNDTKTAAGLFAQFDVPIGGYIVNRVIPPELADGVGVPAYLKKRIEMQRKYLDRIGAELGEDVLAEVPELERDITGLEMIEKVAHIMYGGA
jgi:arsenite/tail-anchored protein-transporting ATPase